MPSRLVWLRRLALAAAIALALGWLPYQAYGKSGLARLVDLNCTVQICRLEARYDSKKRSERNKFMDELRGKLAGPLPRESRLLGQWKLARYGMRTVPMTVRRIQVTHSAGECRYDRPRQD